MYYLEDPSKVTSPNTLLATPPIISQIARFEGDPVKNLENSDERESVAPNPQISNIIPTTKRAAPIPFFIVISLYLLVIGNIQLIPRQQKQMIYP